MSRLVLVTGSSRGIGAATALRLAQDGFDVCVNYRSDQQAAESVATKIRMLGRRASVIQADGSD